jgi:hypothetical protein
MASTALATVPYAVITTTGISGLAARTASSSSTPPRPGIRRSVSTRSTVRDETTRSASSAPPTASTA